MTTLTTRTVVLTVAASVRTAAIAAGIATAAVAVCSMAEAQTPGRPPVTPAPSAAGLTEEDLFDENTIQEIALTVNTRDWNDLREKYTENTYYLADVRWRGLTVRNVGIRSRGNASRNASKPG